MTSRPCRPCTPACPGLTGTAGSSGWAWPDRPSSRRRFRHPRHRAPSGGLLRAQPAGRRRSVQGLDRSGRGGDRIGGGRPHADAWRGDVAARAARHLSGARGSTAFHRRRPGGELDDAQRVRRAGRADPGRSQRFPASGSPLRTLHRRTSGRALSIFGGTEEFTLGTIAQVRPVVAGPHSRVSPLLIGGGAGIPVSGAGRTGSRGSGSCRPGFRRRVGPFRDRPMWSVRKGPIAGAAAGLR